VYRVYNPTTRRIYSSRNVIINELGTIETVSQELQSANEIEISLPEVKEKEKEDENVGSGNGVGANVLVEAVMNPPSPEEFGGDTIIVRPPPEVLQARREDVSRPGNRRSERQRNLRQGFRAKPWPAMLSHLEEPQTLSDALVSKESKEWYAAWESEVDSLVRKDTWELAFKLLPAGREAIGCRLLFSRKDDGRYKPRLVAKGYSQREGLEYTETFAPVAKYNSLRSLLALVCENDWELEGMDVKTAFLHSDLEESLYMEIPEGLHTEVQRNNSGEQVVSRLIKSIYGFKQSPRAWYGKIKHFFLANGFQRSEQDHRVYIHKFFKLILLLYVEDLVITSPSLEDVAWVQNLLHEEFEMTDLGPLTGFLGMEIKRNWQLRTLHLTQHKYTTTILERRAMSTCASVSTPADPHTRLLKSPIIHQTDPNNLQRYQSAVGSLMYAMIGTRQDIAFPVSAVSQHSSNPGPAHGTAVRCIFRYLPGTQTFVVLYGSGYCGGYTDADWGAGEDRKSIGGYAFMINGGAVSWASRKQASIALSSTEAEYMALTQGVKESLLLGELLEGLGALKHGKEIRKVQCDNQAAIALTKNPEYHARTKHIDIQYHFIREHVDS